MFLNVIQMILHVECEVIDGKWDVHTLELSKTAHFPNIKIIFEL